MNDTKTVLVVDDSRVSRLIARQFMLSKQPAGLWSRPPTAKTPSTSRAASLPR